MLTFVSTKVFSSIFIIFLQKKNMRSRSSSPIWKPKVEVKNKEQSNIHFNVKPQALPYSVKILQIACENTISNALAKFNQDKLNFEDLKQLVDSLYLPGKFTFMNTEHSTALDFWEILDGEKRQGVTKQSVNVILLAILNDDPTQQEKATNVDKNNNKSDIKQNIVQDGKVQIGKFNNEGIYSLDKVGIESLRKKYKQIIHTHSLAQKKNKKKQMDPDKRKSVPETNKNSSKLANLARNKIVSLAGEKS